MNCFWGCLIVFLSFSALAKNQLVTVDETLPNGMVRVRVVQMDPSLQHIQSRISQEVIYNKIMTRTERAQFKPELQARPHILPADGTPLWVATKPAWTAADEDAYSKWFATQVDKSFAEDSGLAPDCADTGLLFRWVYARNNLLPVANTLLGSGILFGQFSGSADWDKLNQDPDWKKDERFKAALTYLFANTFTHTIFGDQAPTQVSTPYVRPGSMYMIIRPESGHTQTILSVDPQQGITTIWGNEPGAATIYTSDIIMEFGSVLSFGVWRTPRQTQSGSWELTPANEMPGYSTDQATETFTGPDEYAAWVYGQLGISLSDDQVLWNSAHSFMQDIQMRRQIVAQGLLYCLYKTCAKNSSDYNNYSTFSRDARLANVQNTILGLFAKLGTGDQAVSDSTTAIGSLGPIIVGNDFSYLDLLNSPSAVAAMSADPTVSFATRWGLQPSSETSNFDFLSLSQALAELVSYRDGLIKNNNRETGFLDAGSKMIFTQLKNITTQSDFDTSEINTVQQYYANLTVLSIDPQCADSCTNYQTVTWGAGSVNSIANWSSDVSASVLARWGQ